MLASVCGRPLQCRAVAHNAQGPAIAAGSNPLRAMHVEVAGCSAAAIARTSAPGALPGIARSHQPIAAAAGDASASFQAYEARSAAAAAAWHSSVHLQSISDALAAAGAALTPAAPRPAPSLACSQKEEKPQLA